MTTIVCIADLHEHLVDIPACELLLIAGDVSFAFKGDFAGWGTPWQPGFSDWAFNAPKFAAIPADTDIAVAHGPPRGYGDRTRAGAHVGSTAMTAELERVQPRDGDRQRFACGRSLPPG